MTAKRVVLMGALDRQAAQVRERLALPGLAVVATKARRPRVRAADLLVVVKKFGNHSQVNFAKAAGGRIIVSAGGVTTWVATIKLALGM